MGDPLDEATNFGPMVSQRQREIVEGFIAKGRRGGGAARRRGAPAQPPGFWIEPTVFAEVTDDMAIARDEIFGPVMSVLDFDSEEEVLSRANRPSSARCGGFTRTSTARTRMAAGFEAGTCFINAYNLTRSRRPSEA
jgi:betaine-aldehyde dehydrogenase